MVNQETLELEENLVNLDNQVAKETEVSQEHLEEMLLMEETAYLVDQEIEENPEPLDVMELMGKMAEMVLMVKMDRMV